jgi:uncharacterized FlaG/YvyC family protein
MDISAISRSSELPAAAPVTPVEHAVEQRDVVQAVKAVNAAGMFGQDTELTFQMDRQTHRMVVQMINRQTKEVMSQIPAEYVLRLREDLKAQGNQ